MAQGTTMGQGARIARFHVRAARGDLSAALSAVCDREPESEAKVSAVALLLAAMKRERIDAGEPVHAGGSLVGGDPYGGGDRVGVTEIDVWAAKPPYAPREQWTRLGTVGSVAAARDVAREFAPEGVDLDDCAIEPGIWAVDDDLTISAEVTSWSAEQLQRLVGEAGGAIADLGRCGDDTLACWACIECLRVVEAS